MYVDRFKPFDQVRIGAIIPGQGVDRGFRGEGTWLLSLPAQQTDVDLRVVLGPGVTELRLSIDVLADSMRGWIIEGSILIPADD